MLSSISTTEAIIPLATSLLMGALIGLEREKNKQATKNTSAVGIRTDILICLFGAIAAFFGINYNPWVFYLCLTAILGLIIASYVYLASKFGRIGITSEISTIIVFLIGAIAMAGYVQISVIVGIITTMILSIRKFIHEAVSKINYAELFNTVKFAIIAFVILPILPNQSYDDLVFGFFLPKAQKAGELSGVSILNPYNIWFIVVLVSGISFLGYVLVKYIGKHKGIAFSGLVGGLYSSTATSLTLANKSREMPKTRFPFIAGITLACGISFIRTFIEIRALNEQFFYRTLPAIGLMFVYMMIIGLVYYLKSKREKIDNTGNFETPFKLKQALKLGGFIVATLILSKVILSFAGVNLYFILSSIMAFFAIDDPVIISTATNVGKLMTTDQAKNLILIVLYLNMVQKVGTVYFFGNRKLVKHMIAIFGGLLLVTLAGIIYF